MSDSQRVRFRVQGTDEWRVVPRKEFDAYVRGLSSTARRRLEFPEGAKHDAVYTNTDGEQVREAFFLYVQRRMSGFGGSWERPAGSELKAYPEFAEARRQAMAAKAAVSNFAPPMAIGPVAYTHPEANAAEIRIFKEALARHEGHFADAFMTAPSPGIVAMAMKNNHYPSFDEYLAAVADALRFEYEAAIEAGLMLQIDAPDLALERHITYADRPVGEFVDFVRKVVGEINRVLESVPRDRVRLHVCWGNYESPHDKDVPLNDIAGAILEANVGAFMMPFANPRHQHEIKVFRDHKLAPDQSLLVSGATGGCALTVAARSATGQWLLVYLSEPCTVSLRLDAITAHNRAVAQWIDPTNGLRRPAGTYATTDVPALTCPIGWKDAVLLLEAEGPESKLPFVRVLYLEPAMRGQQPLIVPQWGNFALFVLLLVVALLRELLGDPLLALLLQRGDLLLDLLALRVLRVEVLPDLIGALVLQRLRQVFRLELPGITVLGIRHGLEGSRISGCHPPLIRVKRRPCQSGKS